MKCAVWNCSNNKKFKTVKKISYHRFPKDKALLKKYIKFCQRSEKDFNIKTWMICSEHFAPNDIHGNLQFEMGFKNNRSLKPGAIPTINVNSNTPLKNIDEKRIERLEKRNRKKNVEKLLKEHDKQSMKECTGENINPILEEFPFVDVKEVPKNEEQLVIKPNIHIIRAYDKKNNDGTDNKDNDNDNDHGGMLNSAYGKKMFAKSRKVAEKTISGLALQQKTINSAQMKMSDQQYKSFVPQPKTGVVQSVVLCKPIKSSAKSTLTTTTTMLQSKTLEVQTKNTAIQQPLLLMKPLGTTTQSTANVAATKNQFLIPTLLNTQNEIATTTNQLLLLKPIETLTKIEAPTTTNTQPKLTASNNPSTTKIQPLLLIKPLTSGAKQNDGIKTTAPQTLMLVKSMLTANATPIPIPTRIPTPIPTSITPTPIPLKITTSKVSTKTITTKMRPSIKKSKKNLESTFILPTDEPDEPTNLSTKTESITTFKPADEIKVLKKEIDELNAENKRLKKQSWDLVKKHLNEMHNMKHRLATAEYDKRKLKEKLRLLRIEVQRMKAEQYYRIKEEEHITKEETKQET